MSKTPRTQQNNRTEICRLRPAGSPEPPLRLCSEPRPASASLGPSLSQSAAWAIPAGHTGRPYRPYFTGPCFRLASAGLEVYGRPASSTQPLGPRLPAIYLYRASFPTRSRQASLAEAGRSLWPPEAWSSAEREASGAPAGRGLSHLRVTVSTSSRSRQAAHLAGCSAAGHGRRADHRAVNDASMVTCSMCAQRFCAIRSDLSDCCKKKTVNM